MEAINVDDDDVEVIGGELAVKIGPISADELQCAGRKLKTKKACGIDELPSELWKVILEDSSHPIFAWMLNFMTSLWEGRKVPEEWHLSRVIALFKKGDLGECSNYRPISLINVGYKLYAHILLNRLNDAGAENKIWAT